MDRCRAGRIALFTLRTHFAWKNDGLLYNSLRRAFFLRQKANGYESGGNHAIQRGDAPNRKTTGAAGSLFIPVAVIY